MAGPPQAPLLPHSAASPLRCSPFAVLSPLLPAFPVCRCRIPGAGIRGPLSGPGAAAAVPHGGVVEQRRVGLPRLSLSTESAQGVVTC